MITALKIIGTTTGFIFAVLSSFSQAFKANPDTVFLIPGIRDTVNLVANDLIPPGDSIVVQSFLFNGSNEGIRRTFLNAEKTLIEFEVGWRYAINKNKISAKYILRRTNTNDTSSAIVTFYVHDESVDSIDLNNINARFMAGGYHAPRNRTCFEVPKGSGKGTIFAHSVWIGGNDDNNQLHLAGYRYGQGPNITIGFTQFDFWPGPVMDSTRYSIYTDTVWNYVWKISKSEIDYHKTNWSRPGYQPIRDILTWPGNGDVTVGQAARLAPFTDLNHDGIYDPYTGDSPIIRGDQALYYIFNDDRDVHSETEGEKMRVEIHAMPYVFNIPGDSAFENTVFIYYRIVNRSMNTYNNVFFGIFADMDIGYFDDDSRGCDVRRGMMVGYNGDSVDGSLQQEPEAYGPHPPAQAIVFLGGPLLPPDNRDNPAYIPGNCDIMNTIYPVDPYAINGAGFGDGVVDNERMGMTRYIGINSGALELNPPRFARDYYLRMQGIWLDSVKMIYGGNGHPLFGGYGPECNFQFPGMSDICNWGTNGQMPNGAKNWTYETAGNYPWDQADLGSVGPFTLLPGETVEFDIAYTYARDLNPQDTSRSFNLLGTTVDKIRDAYFSNVLPNGQPFLGISGEPVQNLWDVTVYPNPASSFVTIKFQPGTIGSTTISLADSRGTRVRSVVVKGKDGSAELDVSGLRSGLYLLTVQSEDHCVTKKLIIIR